MNYLVTGGAGFIGSNLVDRLLEPGHKVTVIDDFSNGKEDNLAQHAENESLIVERRSICGDLSDIFEAEKFDAVFHLAYLPRVQFSIEHPVETHEVNVNGLLNLLVACKDHEVKRFVFSSSSSVYGNQEKMPLVETMTPDPLSPYACHKLIGEYYCRLFFKVYGLETISLRYFNVYGGRMDPGGAYPLAIGKFIDCVRKGEPMTIFGDGEQTRDFTYVDDVVNANVLAATTKNSACFGEVFNIGVGNNITINKVASEIIKLSGKELKPVYGQARLEPRNTLADNSKAREFLGWTPGVIFSEGLRKTWDWFAGGVSSL